MTHLFRCHNLADIMADPKAKGETLSQGAKTAIRRMAKQILFDVQFTVDSKYIKKGLEMENSSIALLNSVMGESYVKNTERRENGFITGEPDIVADTHGVDIKTSWSIESFPLTAEEGDDKTYEWQARAYMWLFDKPVWHIAYCLVDTPDHLFGYEDWHLHKVTHIPPYQRVTMVTYRRDADLEAKIKDKVFAAQHYLAALLRDMHRQYDAIADINPTESSVVTLTPVAPVQRGPMSAKQAFA